jgi:hypothetical protein
MNYLCQLTANNYMNTDRDIKSEIGSMNDQPDNLLYLGSFI